MPLTEEQERAMMMNTLKCGTNHGALRILSKRVEEHVARAILRDLHEEGIITVWKHEWDKGRTLIDALHGALKRDRFDTA